MWVSQCAPPQAIFTGPLPPQGLIADTVMPGSIMRVPIRATSDALESARQRARAAGAGDSVVGIESTTIEWGSLAARVVIALGIIAFALLDPALRAVRPAPVICGLVVLGYSALLAALLRARKVRTEIIVSVALDTVVVAGGVLWSAWLSGNEWRSLGGAAPGPHFHEVEQEIFRPLIPVFIVVTLRLRPAPGLLFIAVAAAATGWAGYALGRSAFSAGSMAAQFASLAVDGLAGALIGWVVQKMRDDLAAAVEEQGKLVSTVAHEIRNPLASVRTSIELAREEVAAGRDGAGPALSLAVRGVRRLEGLAKMLQDLELVTVPVAARNEAFNLRAALRDAVAASERVAGERRSGSGLSSKAALPARPATGRPWSASWTT